MDETLPAPDDRPVRQDFRAALGLGYALEHLFGAVRQESERSSIEEHAEVFDRLDSLDPEARWPPRFTTGGVPEAVAAAVGSCHGRLSNLRRSLFDAAPIDRCLRALDAYRSDFARWWGAALRSPDQIPREEVWILARWGLDPEAVPSKRKASTPKTVQLVEQEMPHPERSDAGKELIASLESLEKSLGADIVDFYHIGRQLGDARFADDSGRVESTTPVLHLHGVWRDRLLGLLSKVGTRIPDLDELVEVVDVHDLPPDRIRARCEEILNEILRILVVPPDWSLGTGPAARSTAQVAGPGSSGAPDSQPEHVPRATSPPPGEAGGHGVLPVGSPTTGACENAIIRDSAPSGSCAPDSQPEHVTQDVAAVPEVVDMPDLGLKFYSQGNLNRSIRAQNLRTPVAGKINGRILRLLMGLRAGEFYPRAKVEDCWEKRPKENTFDQMIRNLREVLREVEI